MVPETLYAYPVVFDVYVLNGKYGDPVEALRIGPRRGELIIKKRFITSSETDLMAMLLEPGTGVELLQALLYARIVAMNSLGMTIEGRISWSARNTSKAKVEHATQRWLCKAPGAKAVLDTEKLLKRSAARLNAARISGFDPAHDDAADLPLSDLDP